MRPPGVWRYARRSCRELSKVSSSGWSRRIDWKKQKKKSERIRLSVTHTHRVVTRVTDHLVTIVYGYFSVGIGKSIEGGRPTSAKSYKHSDVPTYVRPQGRVNLEEHAKVFVKNEKVLTLRPSPFNSSTRVPNKWTAKSVCTSTARLSRTSTGPSARDKRGYVGNRFVIVRRARVQHAWRYYTYYNNCNPSYYTVIIASCNIYTFCCVAAE